MKSKVLLMGKSGSGKTSMRSIIFANYLAIGTQRLLPTLDVEHNYVRFLGNLVLNLWDCGGQDRFMENYFKSQRDHIFRAVEVLIYVFDVTSKEREKDVQYFIECLDAIKAKSPNAKVFCLVHKMDLIHSDETRNRVFEERESELKEITETLDLTCFRTSIWDETLYKAWSSIVYSLVPNIAALETQLGNFCNLCDADEVVLFEKATFLVIAHQSRRPHWDLHRFEKISNIVKQFKLSCRNTQAQFQSMEIQNSLFTAFVRAFTNTTHIMVIMSDPRIQPAATLMNIEAARKHFDKLIQT